METKNNPFFWSPNKKETGRRGRGEEEEEEEEEGRSSSKAQKRYGCLPLVWSLLFLYGTIWFVWNSCLIVWLGDCSKPRVVRITS